MTPARLDPREDPDLDRVLAHRIDAAREEERAGIARELHDELGQSLTALKLDLTWVARRLVELPGAAPLVVKLEEAVELTDATLQHVRRISADLRPTVLEEVGLVSALIWHAGLFERRTGTTCSVLSSFDDGSIDRELATTVFRIFQEALTNVARHAQARRVEVRLGEGDGFLELEVLDDGRGLETQGQRQGSNGIRGMSERAARLGGTITVSDAHPRGTMVSLRLPIAALADEPLAALADEPLAAGARR
jgi:signal transduction histidine kinase